MIIITEALTEHLLETFTKIELIRILIGLSKDIQNLKMDQLRLEDDIYRLKNKE